MSIDKFEKQRFQDAIDAGNSFEKLIRKFQQVFYSALSDFIVGFDTENGNLKATAKNTGRLGGIFKIFRSIQPDYQEQALSEIQDWTGKFLESNKGYFAAMDLGGQSADEYARWYALWSWGYDVKTGKLVEGGYLSGLFNNQQIAQRVGAAINSAILQKMSLQEFQIAFRKIFVGNIGQGMLERHWKTNSFDLFQRIDRAANFAYAEQFGLTWAIYSGTLMADSRPFCIERVNKVFNRDQIASWSDLEFQGKPKIGYNPFMDCGGFNCRHHLSWISEPLAKKLLK